MCPFRYAKIYYRHLIIFISSTEPQSTQEYVGKTETENRNDVDNTYPIHPSDVEAMKLVQPFMAQKTPT